MKSSKLFVTVLMLSVLVIFSVLAKAHAQVTLVSPEDGKIFTPFTMVPLYQPKFEWASTETFSSYAIKFSISPTDFTTPKIFILSARVSGTKFKWKPDASSWLKLMAKSYHGGSVRNIYWIVVGKKSDGTKIESAPWSFQVGPNQPVTITYPPDGATLPVAPAPTFVFRTNSNTNFRVEFSPLASFSKVVGFFSTESDPNFNPVKYQTLSWDQWTMVKQLLGKGGYFRIKAWDGIYRKSLSDIRFFNIDYTHTARQAPPIQLGTSGGWQYDVANGYCCGGTLGALVQDAFGGQYVLSNYHVLAGDVQLGGNDRVAHVGDPIIQPGLIDVGCIGSDGQYVAGLSVWSDPLLNTNIDAAIAAVVPGMVRTDGAILEIGMLSNSPLTASLNLAVKKSGRTTGLTRSTISGINGTISVTYDTECAGPVRGKATFRKQIIIRNSSGKFLAAGDSGSLLVQDVASYPRPIGLLYAGSSTIAVANPIADVLSYFGVTMVGYAGAQSAEVTVDAIEQAKTVQARHAESLERIPGAVGHAIGLGRGGQVVIKVYVEEDTPEVRASVPDSIDGMPVEIEVTDPIIPLSRCR